MEVVVNWQGGGSKRGGGGVVNREENGGGGGKRGCGLTGEGINRQGVKGVYKTKIIIKIEK